MPLPVAALAAGSFIKSNWRLFAAAAAVAAAWWWHTSAVNAAAKAAEKATHAHYAVVLADIAGKTAAAAKEFRALEQQAQSAIEKEATDGQKKIDLAHADAAGARAAALSLRQQLDRYRAAARTATHPGAADAGPPAGDALDLLTNLLLRADDRAGELAAFADLAHAAGQTCERAYDQVERTLNSHAQTR